MSHWPITWIPPKNIEAWVCNVTKCEQLQAAVYQFESQKSNPAATSKLGQLHCLPCLQQKKQATPVRQIMHYSLHRFLFSMWHKPPVPTGRPLSVRFHKSISKHSFDSAKLGSRTGRKTAHLMKNTVLFQSAKILSWLYKGLYGPELVILSTVFGFYTHTYTSPFLFYSSDHWMTPRQPSHYIVTHFPQWGKTFFFGGGPLSEQKTQ